MVYFVIKIYNIIDVQGKEMKKIQQIISRIFPSKQYLHKNNLYKIMEKKDHSKY